jgi:hypothetical protein
MPQLRERESDVSWELSGLRRITQQHLAEFLMRIHWRLSRLRFYASSVRCWEAFRDVASYRLWSWTGARPKLNADTASQLSGKYQRLISSAIDNPAAGSTIPGRLLVRIAFHLKPARLKYLAEVIAQLRRLPFSGIVVAIDTNSPQTREFLRAAKRGAADIISVHDKLSHPFLLTWSHREPMRRAVGEFDYFMYVEDDILLTPEAIRLWHERLPALSRAGYLPGFLRVEQNRSGELVSSDFCRRARDTEIVHVDGRPYLLAAFPYQAFWLYDKLNMQAFIASEAFEKGHPPYAQDRVRESAAIGCAFERRGDNYRSRHLLPLTTSLEVDPRCFVFHMPCNYGRLVISHPANLGTIPVDSLFHRGAPHVSSLTEPSFRGHR